MKTRNAAIFGIIAACALTFAAAGDVRPDGEKRRRKPAELRAEYEKKLASAVESYAEAHFEHGKGLFEKKAYNEADNEFTRTLRLVPGHSGAKEHLGRPRNWKTLKNRRTIFDDYRARTKEICEEAADSFAGVAAWCGENGLKEEEKKTYRRALDIFGGNAKALGYLGYVDMGKLGWVRADAAELLKKGYRCVANRWWKKEKAEEIARDWRTCWTLYSDHYRLKTNLPFDDGVETLDDLEALFDLWADYMMIAGPLMTVPGEKLNVWYFRTRDGLIANTRAAVGSAMARNPGTMGIYDNATNTVYYYKSSSRGSLFHECSHQIWDTFYIPGGDDYTRKPGFWAAEAVALIGERFLSGAGKSSFSDWTADCKSARTVFRKSNNPPLADFDAETQSAFFMHGALVAYGSALGYGQFFMDAGGGRHRQAFFRYVKSIHQGLGSNGLFEATFGAKPSAFQTEAVRYLKKF